MENGKHSATCDNWATRAGLGSAESGEYCEYRCGYCVDPLGTPCGENGCGCSHRCGVWSHFPSGYPIVCTEDRCAIWS